jgi:hypothetical protein
MEEPDKPKTKGRHYYKPRYKEILCEMESRLDPKSLSELPWRSLSGSTAPKGIIYILLKEAEKAKAAVLTTVPDKEVGIFGIVLATVSASIVPHIKQHWVIKTHPECYATQRERDRCRIWWLNHGFRSTLTPNGDVSLKYDETVFTHSNTRILKHHKRVLDKKEIPQHPTGEQQIVKKAKEWVYEEGGCAEDIPQPFVEESAAPCDFEAQPMQERKPYAEVFAQPMLEPEGYAAALVPPAASYIRD